MLHKDIQPEISVTYNGKHWKTTVLILHFLPKSKTQVMVRDIDRGRGWDEISESYKGYYARGGNCATGTWIRGQNHGYTDEFKVHIKELEPINTQLL